MAGTLNLRGNLRYAGGLLRALLGAMIFALPLTMTNEMWDLGVTMEPLRLALLLAATFPTLATLSFYAGFEATFSLLDNVLDAFAAMAVSAISRGAVLGLFGIIGFQTPLDEVIGKLAVLSFGASVGALLADKQFNDAETEDEDKAGPGFGGECSSWPWVQSFCRLTWRRPTRSRSSPPTSVRCRLWRCRVCHFWRLVS